jgi:hypothetical protein
MDVYIVVEQEHGEVFVRVFNELELAKRYADEETTGHVTIERQLINTGDRYKRYRNW